MKMKYMSKYFFSFLFLFFSIVTFAQATPKDTAIVAKPQRFGLRVGVDISKLARSLYDSNYKGIEFVGDYRLTKRMYLAAELGNENKNTLDNTLNFTTKGNYVKLGFDHNSYQNWLTMENLIYIGMRYGFSNFSQKLNTYAVYNTSAYFPVAPLVVTNTEYNGLTAHWAEVVVGMKAELFRNFFAGISVRMHYLISEKKPDNFDNLYIPGFNRTYNGKFGAGWNYTLSYFIPIYKTKK